MIQLLSVIFGAGLCFVRMVCYLIAIMLIFKIGWYMYTNVLCGFATPEIQHTKSTRI